MGHIFCNTKNGKIVKWTGTKLRAPPLWALHPKNNNFSEKCDLKTTNHLKPVNFLMYQKYWKNNKQVTLKAFVKHKKVRRTKKTFQTVRKQFFKIVNNLVPKIVFGGHPWMTSIMSLNQFCRDILIQKINWILLWSVTHA